MSRSCHVKVERKLTAEERAYLSLLGTEICHIRTAKKRIEVPQLCIFNGVSDFTQMLEHAPMLTAGFAKEDSLCFVNDKQRSAFEALAIASKKLGGMGFKALPPVAEAIPAEFFIRPKRELVPVRPRINK
jgi:hypothetical protein